MIHEQGRAGIMVTHDLRMCQFVDRVLQMRDGKLARVISDPAEIARFAGGGHNYEPPSLFVPPYAMMNGNGRVPAPVF